MWAPSRFLTALYIFQAASVNVHPPFNFSNERFYTQKVRGDDTHPGSPCSQQVSCDEEIQDAHSKSSAPIRERERLVHVLEPQGRLFPRLHGRGVGVPVFAVRLHPSPMHFLEVLGGSAGAAQKSRKCILYLDDLLLLSHSEEAARMDTMAVIDHISLLGFTIKCHPVCTLPVLRRQESDSAVHNVPIGASAPSGRTMPINRHTTVIGLKVGVE